MRKYFFALVALIVTSLYMVPTAHAIGFQNESFKKVFYFNGPAGKGAKSGMNAANAKAIADQTLMAIDAGTIITKVYVIVDTAVTGSSALDVGDDDDQNGFAVTADVTLGTPGMYSYVSTGAYLASGAAKFYRVGTKSVKLDMTGTNTAGALRVVVEGYRVGA